MIEKQIPIRIPPGIVKNGTLEDRAGRWADGQFVRFLTEGGVPVSVGPVDSITLSGTAPSGGQVLRAWSWFVANGTDVAQQAVVVGKQTKIYVFDELTLARIDITPAGLTDPGAAHASWSFANFGDILLASRSNGPGINSSSNLYSWDPDTVGTDLAAVTNAPTSVVRGVIVTPENFVMIIRSDRRIQWASQGTLTTWTAAEGNSAGDIDVPTAGQLIRLIVLGGETIALGDQEVWVIDYVDEPLYYGSRKVCDHCGIIGPNAVAQLENTAYWMGPRGFYQYDGFVRPLPCPISDEVFGDMEPTSDGRIFALAVPVFNEIWWYYPTNGQTTPDRRLRYNTENQTWVLDNMTGQTHAAGTDAVWPPEVGASHTSMVPLVFDELDNVYAAESPGNNIDAYLESGVIKLGDGDRKMRVQKLIRDGAHANDNVVLFYGDWPGGSESSASGGGTVGVELDVRFTARYVRYKQFLSTATSRVGVPRLGVIESSRR